MMNVQRFKSLSLASLRRMPSNASWLAMAFAVRTTVASLIALYIAFQMNLDDPKWAAMTVWIVAQTNRGMTLSKSQYRILGTAIGAVMALVLTALFAQTPELFLLALAAWIGLCTGVATSLRNFRVYAGVLAGYTAAIVGIGAASAPLHAFDIAVARCLYIVLGIVVEAMLTSCFAPGAPVRDVQERFGRYVAQASGMCARVLRRKQDDVAMHRLFAGALALDAAAEFAATTSSTARQKLGQFRVLAISVLSQLAAAQTLSEQLPRRPDIDDSLFEDTARLLDRVATAPDCLRAEAVAVRSTVDRAMLAEAEASGDACTPRLLVLDRLGWLLSSAENVMTRMVQIDRADAPPSRLRFSYHRDAVLGWKNGIRAFVAVLVASAFWIWSAWPAGAGFVTIVGVVSALFATRPNARGVTLAFLKGAICAALAGALCNFALLPGVSGFIPLACIVGIFMVGAGLAMCNPRTAAIGSGCAVFFWNFISPVNSARIDDAAFLNGTVATLLGIACGTAVFAILFPSDPASIRARLHRTARQDLLQIALAPKKWDADAWLSRTADRLSRLLVIGSADPRAITDIDLHHHVATWTIGDSLLPLHDIAGKHPIARRPLAIVLKRLERLDVKPLARVCGVAAIRLKRHSRKLGDQGRRELLRGAILLQTIADTANSNADFLSDRTTTQ